ncbi:MAG: glycosyltransferase family 4 protein [Parahaliea sp.]
MTTILSFVYTYLPGYKAGGPLQSVANIVGHLGESFDFRIVTRDRDSGDETAYAGIAPGQWSTVGGARVWYLAPERQTLMAVARLMRETPHDAIYLNSFFQPCFGIYPLLAMRLGLAPRKPVIVAPRGEFSEGALALKAAKKKLFLTVARLLRLYRDVLWHASSAHEARDIRHIFGARASVCIASNLPRKHHECLAHVPRLPGAPLRLLFLSRISPMKNLSFVVDVLERCSVPVECSLVGFVDAPKYWAACESRIAVLPPHIRVQYHGTIPASEVPGVMAQHDLFFLPTQGENFGHVIIEALGAGTPALISDRTPWQDLEAQGAGWVYPLVDAEPYVAVIERLYHEKATDAAARRNAALDYAQRFVRSEALLVANRRLFEAALDGVAG